MVTLLESGEGQLIEFEKNIPSADDIAREIVAFANSDGGKLILGIDDKMKHLTGVDISDDFETSIKNLVEKNCHPKINYKIDYLNKNGKQVIIIDVEEGEEKPYRTDDIAYIRDGLETRPAKEQEEKNITNPWAGKGLNKRQLRAMQIIAEHGSTTNREYREAFGVSHKTAHLELSILESKGLVLIEGQGRSTSYVIDPTKITPVESAPLEPIPFSN